MSNNFVTVRLKDLTEIAVNQLVGDIVGVALVDGCHFTKDPSEEQIYFDPCNNLPEARELAGDLEVDPNLAVDGDNEGTALMRTFVGTCLGTEFDIRESLAKRSGTPYQLPPPPNEVLIDDFDALVKKDSPRSGISTSPTR